MSTSINLLDQDSNVNDVDMMVFEPSLLFPLPQLGGGGGVIDAMLQKISFNHVIFPIHRD